MKKFSQIVLVVLLGLLFTIGVSNAKWYPGIVHVHSTFSDGDRTPGMVIQNARKAGFKFLIETDHYEQIGEPQTLRSRIVKDYGFDKYWQKFSSNDLIIIKGAEIEALRGNARAHTLVLGDLGYDKVLMNLQGKEGNQQAVIDYLNQKGFLSVAAHPSLVNVIGLQTWRGECSDFSYDKSQCKGISGIEFFNDRAEGYEQTLRWYLNLLGRNNLFVTAGCDRHIIEDPEDRQRWSRVTWVWVEGDCTRQKILDAFRQGRTYASRENVQLLPIPSREDPPFRISFKVQKRKVIDFPFKLIFEKETKIDGYALYRDGKRVFGVTYKEYWDDNPKSQGFKEYWCLCDDPSAPPGEHSYVIEVKNFLITSPIRVMVE